jgi:hypothetical protein
MDRACPARVVAAGQECVDLDSQVNTERRGGAVGGDGDGEHLRGTAPGGESDAEHRAPPDRAEIAADLGLNRDREDATKP